MARKIGGNQPKAPLGKRLAVFGQVSMVLGILTLVLVAPFAARLGTQGGWMFGVGLVALGGVVYLISRSMRRSARRAQMADKATR